DTSGLARESIRKTLGVLAQALDRHGLEPNPARDRRTVKLPARVHEHVSPPSFEHIEAVYQLLPSAFRLPLLVLDASGMRVGEAVGQRSIAVTADTYSHVLIDERELDYGELLLA